MSSLYCIGAIEYDITYIAIFVLDIGLYIIAIMFATAM